MSNEQGPENRDPPVGAPAIDPAEPEVSTAPLLILAGDADVVCIDDACAPSDLAR